jgi:GTP-binding protein
MVGKTPVNTSHYRGARFLTSAERVDQCPPDFGIEVAFAGRSNAGKSSAINALTDQKKLARASKTPGRTRLINFFALNDDKRLVDLPGYGYAKVSAEMRQKWQHHLGEYLNQRSCLKGLVLLMDIRHPCQEFDTSMIDWAVKGKMPLHILLTKADKLSKGAARNTELSVRALMEKRKSPITVQCFSAHSGEGIVQLIEKLDEWYEMQKKAGEPT